MIRNKENNTLLERPTIYGIEPKTQNRINEEFEILDDVAQDLFELDSKHDTETILELGVSVDIDLYLDFVLGFYVYPVTGGFLVEFYDSYGIARNSLLKKSASDIYVLCQEIEAAKRIKQAA